MAKCKVTADTGLLVLRDRNVNVQSPQIASVRATIGTACR